MGGVLKLSKIGNSLYLIKRLFGFSKYFYKLRTSFYFLIKHSLSQIFIDLVQPEITEIKPSARLEKRLLIIRNLQSEKAIVDKKEEFYLSKESFLLKRKDFHIISTIVYSFSSDPEGE